MATKSVQTKILEDPADALKKFRLQMPASGDPRVVVNLAGVGRTVIQTRTLKGIGSGGKAFAPYSTKPYYAPIDRRPPGYKKPTGGRTTSLRTGKPMKSAYFEGGYGQYHAAQGFGSKVTLSNSNKMLASIQIAASSPVVATLFFAGREEAAKAHGHEFGTTTTKRPFFDLSDFVSIKALESEFLDSVRDMAKRAKIEFERRGLK